MAPTPKKAAKAATPKPTKPAKAATIVKGPETAAPIDDRAALVVLQTTSSATVQIRQLVAWPMNPRRDFDEAKVDLLASSIAAQGLLQPLLVRALPEPNPLSGLTMFEVIAGERRRRALWKLMDAGDRDPMDIIPVQSTTMSDREALLAAGAENLARDDMHALDEALLFDNLVKAGMEEREICQQLGVGERTIFRRRRLLNLIPAAQDLFREGGITQRQAEALAGGDESQQQELIADMDEETDEYEIRSRLAHGFPALTCALFEQQAYLDRGGRMIDGAEDMPHFRDIAIFKDLQAEAIAAKIVELRKKWPWVDQLSMKPNEYASYFREQDYTHNINKFPGAGAVVEISDGLTRVKIFEGMLRPGVRERLAKLTHEQVEEYRAAAEAAAERGEAMPELPPEPGKPDAADEEKGGAARLMTKGQIQTVKAAQTLALRCGLAQRPKSALAYACMIFMEAEPYKISITTPNHEKAPPPLTELAVAVELLGGIWDSAPEPDSVTSFLDLHHFFGANDAAASVSRAADCYSALVNYASEEQLMELFAALIAARAANFYNDFDASQTPACKALTAAVANEVHASMLMSRYWAPTADFWKGYDRTGLRAALSRGGDHPPDKTKSLGKGELVALCTQMEPAASLGMPELAFLTPAEQQNAVIETRAAVIEADQAAVRAIVETAGDKQREAA